MINKKTVGDFLEAILLIFFIFSLNSCIQNKSKIDTSKITINSDFKRFDVDLFNLSLPVSVEAIKGIRNSYPTFFDLFCSRIIRIPVENDSVIAAHLTLFIGDKDVKEIWSKTKSVFMHTDQLNENINEMLKYYHYYFPQKFVPDIVTYVSAFNYTVITTDSLLGIGLDMYLGKDCSFYPALGLPKYMVDKLTQEFILRDIAKALFQSDYDPDEVSNEFLSQLIYQGKLLYYTDLLLPEEPDTIKIGYQAAQLDWCKKNESNIWGFMIENNLLYSKESSRYIRYLSDGNTTQGLPKESPGKVGAWIGWQIVRSYMANYKEAKIDSFLLETDAQKILSESGYKPGK